MMNNKLSKKQMGGLAVASAVAVGLFVWFASLQSQPGFPLDDGWIHQTYARNLVRSGRWEYVPGVVSSGSTAPLWTLLLAVGYLLKIPHLFWAYLLGGLSLFWLAVSTTKLWRQFWPEKEQAAWVAGLSIIFTWPLVWAAASGMETLLFAAIGMQLLSNTIRQLASNAQIVKIGLLSGLLILTRPDGVVLLMLITLYLIQQTVLSEKRSVDFVKQLVIFGITLLIPLVPYFLFNWNVSGTIWPNTLYAKQVEYTVLLEQPIVSRVWQLLFYSWGAPQGSPHILLLPGLIFASWLALRNDWQSKRLFFLLPLFWAGGHVVLYAWRLPVTYQHGRYLLPTLPIWILFGLAGWQTILAKIKNKEGIWRLLHRAAVASFGILLGIFLFIGGFQGYATDVAFIEGEMVTMAHWVNENTPENVLIASHDIGAIGYFSERPLLDLAGLITPDVIELLNSESQLSQYVLASEADYLVTAPGWAYEDVVTAVNVQELYSTNYQWTIEQGLNNMTIYSLR